MFAKRLGLDEAVRAALAANFERWNGRGLPDGLQGRRPSPGRCGSPSSPGARGPRPDRGHRRGPSRSSRRGAARRTTPSSPTSSSREARGVVGGGRAGRLLGRRARRRAAGAPLDDAAVHESLLVLADFADLKSPWTSGHSRAVAALAREACGPARRGGRAGPRPRPRRGPQHDLGQARSAHPRRAGPGRDPHARHRPAPAAGAVHRRAGRRGRRRARAHRRLRLPPARQRRAPRRGAAGASPPPTATRP